MTEIKLELFTFKGFELRAVNLEGQPYFVGKDVAELLGYQRPDNAIRSHVEEEDKLMHQINTSGQSRRMVLFNKKGLSSLITKSKLLTKYQKHDLYKAFDIEKALTSRKEIEFLQLLEDVITPLGLTIRRQHDVNGYKLDGYIPEIELAIEYDETHHKRQVGMDKKREQDIKDVIECSFVRVSEDEKDSVNVGYVIKAIIENKLNGDA